MFALGIKQTTDALGRRANEVASTRHRHAGGSKRDERRQEDANAGVPRANAVDFFRSADPPPLTRLLVLFVRVALAVLQPRDRFGGELDRSAGARQRTWIFITSTRGPLRTDHDRVRSSRAIIGFPRQRRSQRRSKSARKASTEARIVGRSSVSIASTAVGGRGPILMSSAIAANFVDVFIVSSSVGAPMKRTMRTSPTAIAVERSLAWWKRWRRTFWREVDDEPHNRRGK